MTDTSTDTYKITFTITFTFTLTLTITFTSYFLKSNINLTVTYSAMQMQMDIQMQMQMQRGREKTDRSTMKIGGRKGVTTFRDHNKRVQAFGSTTTTIYKKKKISNLFPMSLLVYMMILAFQTAILDVKVARFFPTVLAEKASFNVKSDSGELLPDSMNKNANNFLLYTKYVDFLRNEKLEQGGDVGSDISASVPSSSSSTTFDFSNLKSESERGGGEKMKDRWQHQKQMQEKEVNTFLSFSKYALSNEESVTFTVHLPQCNLDKVHLKAKEVADMNGNGFGSYLSTEELRALTRCENHNENVAFVRQWLEEGFQNSNNDINLSIYGKDEVPSNLKSTKQDDDKRTSIPLSGNIYQIEEFSTMLKIDTTISGMKTLFPTKTFMRIPQNTEGVGVYGIKVIAKSTSPSEKDIANNKGERKRKLSDDNEENMKSDDLKDYLEIPEELEGRITMITGLTQSNMKMELRSHYYRKPQTNRDLQNGKRKDHTKENFLDEQIEGENFKTTKNPYFNMINNLKQGAKVFEEKEELSRKKQIVKYGEEDEEPKQEGEGNEEGTKEGYEPFVPETTPSLLEAMYNKPPETERYDGYSQGVLTYNDDTFVRKDIYTAAEMMGTSDIAKNPVILENNAEDNADMETTMDMEYISLLGAGVPSTAFLTPNYGATLDMIQYILNHDELLPSGGGPYVWSMSWGFPAPLLYLLAGDGTSSEDYVKTCEDLFAQLASLGITIVVASGDDGAVEANPACPVNSSWPLFFNDTPFLPSESTKCSTFELKAPSGKSCYLPTAYKGITSMDMDIAGLQCYEVFSECPGLFTSEINNLIVSGEQDQCEINGDIVDGALFRITSTCECNKNPSVIKEMFGCTISPFAYKKEVNKEMFWTAYPGSSAYVTSVGASAVNPFAEPSGINEIAAYSFNGGGGFDAFIPRPWYQKAEFTTVVDDYVKLPNGEGPPNLDYFQASNRGIPDISAIAENIVVYIAGQTILTQGTSASAPIIAGIVSVLNAKRMTAGLPAIGQLNPHLYRMQSFDPNYFNKLNRFMLEFQGGLSQDGSNSLALHYGVAYVCEHGFNSNNKVGWDGVTGLGTPKFDMWEKYFLDESLSNPNPQEGRRQKRNLMKKKLRV